MASASAAKLESTPIASISEYVATLRQTFRSQRTKPLEYRLVQLRKLYWGLADYTDELVEAMRLDLNKPTFEALATEIGWAKNDCIFAQKNLEKWMKDEAAPDVPLMMAAMAPKIRKDPIGTVLVIGAYNFPVQLAICPLIGAIAAGCTAVLKPSELSPHTAIVLEKIFHGYLDPDAYKVVQGGVAETSELLDQRWDKIFYTGGGAVGTIVAKKAAETLTPVVLELGGINPAIVTKNADPRLAARRLLWGKTLNAGQVCLSQNYTMVDEEIYDAFIDQLGRAMKEFYPNGTRDSPDYSHIVNSRHFHRIKKMLDESAGKIIMGGEMDESCNYIAPTVIRVSSAEDSTVATESFGPLMPVLPVKNLDEAISIARGVSEGPLGLYAFGNAKETEKILAHLPSGGASINDSYAHGSISTLPFGGVGESGNGSYRGKASFDCFTHRRSVTKTPSWIEALLSIRYPPFPASKVQRYQSQMDLKPNFDRNGKIQKGLAYWIAAMLSLGGSSARGTVLRWVTLLAVAGAVKRYADRQSL